jgi:hypothetical protein
VKKPIFNDDEPEKGLFVFTEEMHLKRGYCCGNGCLHCPYDYKNVIDLDKKQYFIERQKENKCQKKSK